MLAFEWEPDTVGEPRGCMICDARWISTGTAPRAYVGVEYLGHVCASCVSADPDTLLARLRVHGLSWTRDTLRAMEALEQWLATNAPRQRRRGFRVITNTAGHGQR